MCKHWWTKQEFQCWNLNYFLNLYKSYKPLKWVHRASEIIHDSIKIEGFLNEFCQQQSCLEMSTALQSTVVLFRCVQLVKPAASPAGWKTNDESWRIYSRPNHSIVRLDWYGVIKPIWTNKQKKTRVNSEIDQFHCKRSSQFTEQLLDLTHCGFCSLSKFSCALTVFISQILRVLTFKLYKVI